MWERVATRAVLGLIAIAGCGEDALDTTPEPEPEPELEPAAFDPGCGHTGPFRLFAPPDGEAMWLAWRHDTRWQGGRLFLTQHCPPDSCDPVSTIGSPAAIYWVGPCGESWRRIDVSALEGVHLPLDRFSRVIGCRPNGDIVAIDIAEDSMRTVMTTSSCAAVPHDEGMVVLNTIDENLSELTWVPSLVEPEPAAIALDLIVASLPGSVQSAPGVLFVLTDAAELIAWSPLQRDRTVLAEDVAAFSIAADGRFVLWQEIEPFTEGVANHPLWLVDRMTGETVHAGWGSLYENAWLGAGSTSAYADPALGGRRVVLLPELQTLQLLPGTRDRGRVDDGRLFIHDEDTEESFLLDPTSGELSRVCDTRCTVIGTPWGFDLESGQGSQTTRWRFDLETMARVPAAQNFAHARRIGPRRIVAERFGTDTTSTVVFDEGEPEPRLVARPPLALAKQLMGSYPTGLVDEPLLLETFEDDRLTFWAAALAP